MAWPREKIGVVDKRAIMDKRIALLLTVIWQVSNMPSLVAIKGPMVNNASPLYVNGRTNHRKRMSPLTNNNLEKTFFIESLAMATRNSDMPSAGSNAKNLLDMATITEKSATTIILTRGSRP
jgi:hypothetical protein